MNARPAKSVLALAMLALAGCAAIPVHDAVLEDARTYVYGVRSDSQVVTYAPVEIDNAIVTLRRADDVLARGGTLAEVHDLASLARDRATLAQQTARTKSAEAAAQAERQRLELAARAREAEAAQRAARDAQLQAEASRQQAFAAQQQAAAARRQAESAEQHAAAVQRQALSAEASLGALHEQLFDLGPKMSGSGPRRHAQRHPVRRRWRATAAFRPAGGVEARGVSCCSPGTRDFGRGLQRRWGRYVWEPAAVGTARARGAVRAGRDGRRFTSHHRARLRACLSDCQQRHASRPAAEPPRRDRDFRS